MKIKKKTVEIDLYVDNKRLTEKEKMELSDFIKAYKQRKNTPRKRISKAA